MSLIHSCIDDDVYSTSGASAQSSQRSKSIANPAYVNDAANIDDEFSATTVEASSEKASPKPAPKQTKTTVPKPHAVVQPQAAVRDQVKFNLPPKAARKEPSAVKIVPVRHLPTFVVRDKDGTTKVVDPYAPRRLSDISKGESGKDGQSTSPAHLDGKKTEDAGVRFEYQGPKSKKQSVPLERQNAVSNNDEAPRTKEKQSKASRAKQRHVQNHAANIPETTRYKAEKTKKPEKPERSPDNQPSDTRQERKHGVVDSERRPSDQKPSKVSTSSKSTAAAGRRPTPDVGYQSKKPSKAEVPRVQPILSPPTSVRSKHSERSISSHQERVPSILSGVPFLLGVSSDSGNTKSSKSSFQSSKPRSPPSRISRTPKYTEVAGHSHGTPFASFKPDSQSGENHVSSPKYNFEEVSRMLNAGNPSPPDSYRSQEGKQSDFALPDLGTFEPGTLMEQIAPPKKSLLSRSGPDSLLHERTNVTSAEQYRPNDTRQSTQASPADPSSTADEAWTRKWPEDVYPRESASQVSSISERMHQSQPQKQTISTHEASPRSSRATPSSNYHAPTVESVVSSKTGIVTSRLRPRAAEDIQEPVMSGALPTKDHSRVRLSSRDSHGSRDSRGSASRVVSETKITYHFGPAQEARSVRGDDQSTMTASQHHRSDTSRVSNVGSYRPERSSAFHESYLSAHQDAPSPAQRPSQHSSLVSRTSARDVGARRAPVESRASRATRENGIAVGHSDHDLYDGGWRVPDREATSVSSRSKAGSRHSESGVPDWQFGDWERDQRGEAGSKAGDEQGW